MSRLLCLAALVCLSACDKSVGKDRDSVTIDVEQADDGTFIGAFLVQATVGPVARELEPRLTIRSKSLAQEGSSLDLGSLVGLVSVGSDSGENSAEFDFVPRFSSCDEAGYTEEADGGCTVEVVSIVAATDLLVVTGAGILKVFEPDGYTGSTADLEVTVTASNGNE